MACHHDGNVEPHSGHRVKVPGQRPAHSYYHDASSLRADPNSTSTRVINTCPPQTVTLERSSIRFQCFMMYIKGELHGGQTRLYALVADPRNHVGEDFGHFTTSPIGRVIMTASKFWGFRAWRHLWKWCNTDSLLNYLRWAPCTSDSVQKRLATLLHTTVKATAVVTIFWKYLRGVMYDGTCRRSAPRKTGAVFGMYPMSMV